MAMGSGENSLKKRRGLSHTARPILCKIHWQSARSPRHVTFLALRRCTVRAPCAQRAHRPSL